MLMKNVMLILFLANANTLLAQENDTVKVEKPAGVPVVSYSSPKEYTIAGIEVTGCKDYDDFVLIGFSGLSVGDVISVPGSQITDAVKRYWKHGLFSDVKISASRIEDDKIWLEIHLKQRSRVSQVNYNGIKKSEREDLESRLQLKKGHQITPNLADRAKLVIQKYFEGKGFKNVDVEINQTDDLSHEGQVIVDVNIDKNEKVKIRKISFRGNEALTDSELKKAMKKTNEKFNLLRDFKSSLLEIFSTKKFTAEEYEKDKKNIISKYNEMGYRDAVLTADTIRNVNDKTVDIDIRIEEGRKYYLKGITFVGNTHYSTDFLTGVLNMKAGEVYNQKKLNERLISDDDALSNVYYNNGYLFFSTDPIETDVSNDSIALEIRIQEGPQAVINRIIINGNERLYEDVVRRELYTKPGMMFSREDLMRSVRELAQSGHFDPERLVPQPLPNAENGTVDIKYDLVSKANDQIEFSAGWGQTGLIGKLSLKFTNFSMKNLLNPNSYKGIIPQGEGQTLTLSGETNGRYYQAYSIAFMDPWFGKKRPNALSLNAYFSRQTGISQRYYDRNYYQNSFEQSFDPDQSFMSLGGSVGYGKRLNWPDNYFQFSATLNYQMYIMKNWNSFLAKNGNSHNINLELRLQRNSIDNPLYTRRGSQLDLSVALTPPYSLFDGKDYAAMDDQDSRKFKFVEYHKWKFKAKFFSPLAPSSVKRTPVLMTRVEYGFVGSYNKHKKSPFETFYVGGDGMSGYSGTYGTETIALRGYENGSIAGSDGPETFGYAYSKLAMELRYPFLLEPSSTIYGLVFLEAGNAWKDMKSFNPFDLKRSAGVGVRIFLPMIGLMGLDWGYGFDVPNYGGKGKRNGSKLSFVLGQEF